MANTTSVAGDTFSVQPRNRRQVVLQRLMHDFEFYVADDVEESEADLMIQLSGMITRDEFAVE